MMLPGIEDMIFGPMPEDDEEDDNGWTMEWWEGRFAAQDGPCKV